MRLTGKPRARNNNVIICSSIIYGWWNKVAEVASAINVPPQYLE
jgi:hypothetical protein